MSARPEGFDAAACRWGPDCHQRIWWATIVDPIEFKTQRHGDGRPKRVPLNPGANPDGQWCIAPGRIGKVFRVSLTDPIAGERFVGHHTTCPHAAERKAARAKPAPPRRRQPKTAKRPPDPPEPDPQLGFRL